MENAPIILSETRRAPLPAERVIGRTAELEHIAQRLEESDALLLLNGLGGVGKTTLAGFYLERHGARYRHAAWITYTGHFTGDFVRQLRFNRLIASEGLPDKDTEAFALLADAMDRLPGPNLLIIDNLNTPDQLADVAAHRTRLPRGWKVLLTARVASEAFDRYDVGVLAQDEAAELFRRHYTQRPGDSEVRLHELLELTGRHTLTIELLAKTLANSPGWSLDRMLEHLQKQGLRQPDAAASPVTTTHSRDRAVMLEYVAMIFEINIAALGERAREALIHLALFPSFVHDFERLALLEACEDAPERDLLAATLSHLVNQGLLETRFGDDSAPGWYMHPVLQEIVRRRWPADYEQVDSVVRILEAETAEARPILAVAPVLPYAQTIVSHLPFDTLPLASLCWNIAQHHMDMGNWAVSEQFMQQSNHLYRQKEASWSIAASYERLGALNMSTGNYDQAIEYYKKGITLFHDILNTTSTPKRLKRELATIYANCARALLATGKVKDGRDLFIESDTMRQALIADNPEWTQVIEDIVASTDVMASLYMETGKTAEAAALFERNYNLCESLISADPDSEKTWFRVLDFLIKFGAFSLNTGSFAQALELLDTSRERLEEIIGQNQLSLTVKYLLAECYYMKGEILQKQGIPEEAIEWYIRYNDFIKEYRIFGAMSTAIGINRANEALLEIYMNQGRLDDALEHFNKEINYYQGVDTRRSIQAGFEMSWLYEMVGDIYKNSGDMAEAEIFYERSFACSVDTQKWFPDTLISNLGLAFSHYKMANFHQETGRAAQALSLYRRALELVTGWGDGEIGASYGDFLQELERKIAEADPQGVAT